MARLAKNFSQYFRITLATTRQQKRYAHAIRHQVYAKEMGWERVRTVPHGGHQLGLHMAIGLGLGGTESYPGVFQPYGGFADNVEVVDGMTGPPQAPGLGIETRSKMIADMRERLELGQ